MCLNHQDNSNATLERNMDLSTMLTTNQPKSEPAGYDDIMKQIASQAQQVRQTFESSKRKPIASSATIAAAHLMASNNKKRKFVGSDLSAFEGTSSDSNSNIPPGKMRFTRHFHSPIASLARAECKKETINNGNKSDLSANNVNNLGRISPLAVVPAKNTSSPSFAKSIVSHINYNDVICMNGTTSSELIGNRRYRVWIDLHRQAFAKAPFEDDRRKIAHSIINTVKGSSPSGRFLSQDKSTGEWFDIGYQQAYLFTMKDLSKGNPVMGSMPRPSPAKASVRRTFASKAA